MIRRSAQKIFPRRIRVFPAEEVTSRAEDEVAAREVGMRDEDIAAIWRSVTSLYRVGLHPAMALCVRVRGKVVIDRVIGHSRGNDPRQFDTAGLKRATLQTPFNLFSASKAVTAVLTLMVIERGLLGLDDKVSDWIPEFGRNGKEKVTVRHILTHRAGIPWIPGDSIDLDALGDNKQVMNLICDLKPISNPGQEAAYHALSGGFVLGELIRLATGRTIETMLYEEVRKPLGFCNFGFGVPRPRLSQVAMESFTGPDPPRALNRMLKRALGMEMQGLVDLANDERFLLSVVPAGNVVGTAREANTFFEMLRMGGAFQGTRILSPETVAMAVNRQRSRHEFDRIIKLPIRYGLGFMLGSEHLSFYGRSTKRAFGHLGFTNVLVWADPEREMSVAFLNSGKPFVTPEVLLWLNVMRVISGRVPKSGRSRN
jgi:CubicO group peptidase (beta-lactamase class C family)